MKEPPKGARYVQIGPQSFLILEEGQTEEVLERLGLVRPSRLRRLLRWLGRAVRWPRKPTGAPGPKR